MRLPSNLTCQEPPAKCPEIVSNCLVPNSSFTEEEFEAIDTDAINIELINELYAKMQELLVMYTRLPSILANSGLALAGYDEYYNKSQEGVFSRVVNGNEIFPSDEVGQVTVIDNELDDTGAIILTTPTVRVGEAFEVEINEDATDPSFTLDVYEGTNSIVSIIDKIGSIYILKLSANLEMGTVATLIYNSELSSASKQFEVLPPSGSIFIKSDYTYLDLPEISMLNRRPSFYSLKEGDIVTIAEDWFNYLVDADPSDNHTVGMTTDSVVQFNTDLPAGDYVDVPVSLFKAKSNYHRSDFLFNFHIRESTETP